MYKYFTYDVHVELNDHQSDCQGQDWAALISLMQRRNGDSICSLSYLPNTAHMGWLISLALLCTLFLSAPCTDQGYRWLLSAIRCCVADVTAFIVTMIYWFRMTTATGRNTWKRPGAGEGSFWMPAPPTTFIPSLSGLYISLLVIVWPSAVFRAALTTLLSKHGVCAKRRHLPFTPLIQLYWVPSVRWSANLLEG